MTTPLRIDGVDLSHWQSGTLDLAAAKKAGVKFVFHKATDGQSYRDPLYATRRTQAAKAGIPFGAYHFAQPAAGTALAEAQHFIDIARPKVGDLRPVLDLEVNHSLSQAQLTTWVATFVSHVRTRTGVRPIIYTSFTLDDTFDCLLWQPRYNNTNTPPRVAAPWKQWDIWQFSNGVYGVPNSVPGIGHCDINHLRDGLTVDVLLIKPRVEPKPTPTPDPKPLPETELSRERARLTAWRKRLGTARPRVRKAIDNFLKGTPKR